MNNEKIYNTLINALQDMQRIKLGHDVHLKTKKLYDLADDQQRKFLDAMSVEIFGKGLKGLFEWSDDQPEK
jgi:hypothetical protein